MSGNLKPGMLLEKLLQENDGSAEGSAVHDQFTQEMFEQLTQRSLSLLQATVDATTWNAFWRIVVHGEPETTVAEALQLSTRAVRQAKYQVLFRLREFLSDY